MTYKKGYGHGQIPETFCEARQCVRSQTKATQTGEAVWKIWDTWSDLSVISTIKWEAMPGKHFYHEDDIKLPEKLPYGFFPVLPCGELQHKDGKLSNPQEGAQFYLQIL